MHHIIRCYMHLILWCNSIPLLWYFFTLKDLKMAEFLEDDFSA